MYIAQALSPLSFQGSSPHDAYMEVILIVCPNSTRHQNHQLPVLSWIPLSNSQAVIATHAPSLKQKHETPFLFWPNHACGCQLLIVHVLTETLRDARHLAHVPFRTTFSTSSPKLTLLQLTSCIPLCPLFLISTTKIDLLIPQSSSSLVILVQWRRLPLSAYESPLPKAKSWHQCRDAKFRICRSADAPPHHRQCS